MYRMSAPQQPRQDGYYQRLQQMQQPKAPELRPDTGSSPDQPGLAMTPKPQTAQIQGVTGTGQDSDDRLRKLFQQMQQNRGY